MIQRIEDILQATGGALLQKKTDQFSGASVDSRETQPGEAFFCLRGNRADGHSFAGEATKKGASVIVIERGRRIPEGCERVSVVGVPDPLRALQDLASMYRKRATFTVVGVTGSNGKTTVKEMIASMLAEAAGGSGFVLKSEGNKNTDIGLALTLSRASNEHHFAVFEMAMRARGEIRRLAEVTRPCVGVITNIGPAHIEFLDSLENIAKAKGELLEELPVNGLAIYPVEETLRFKEMACQIPPENHWTFGESENAKVRILKVERNGLTSWVHLRSNGQEFCVVTPFAGYHNARNAACAAAAGLALGLPPGAIRNGLAKAELPGGRSAVYSSGGRWLIDDTYNANPASMQAAIETLVNLAEGSKAYAVLGDMLELGENASIYHWQTGCYAATLGVEGIVGVGKFAGPLLIGAEAGGCSKVSRAANPDEAAEVVSRWSKAGDWILVKASRAVELECVIEKLKHLWEEVLRR